MSDRQASNRLKECASCTNSAIVYMALHSELLDKSFLSRSCLSVYYAAPNVQNARKNDESEIWALKQQFCGRRMGFNVPPPVFCQILIAVWGKQDVEKVDNKGD